MKNRLNTIQYINDNIIDYNKKIHDITNRILNCKLLLVGGSGGSAADSGHFVGELMGRFEGILTPFPAINMMSEISTLTAITNDISYDGVFIQYINAFKQFEPCYLFISTSGKSTNILNAINFLIDIDHNTNIILITGDTTSVHNNNIMEFNIPNTNTAIIQEIGLMILHDIARVLKNRLVNNGGINGFRRSI